MAFASWVKRVIAADNDVERVIHRVTLVGTLRNCAIKSIADWVDAQIVVNIAEGWVHEELGDLEGIFSVSDRVLLVIRIRRSDRTRWVAWV